MDPGQTSHVNTEIEADQMRAQRLNESQPKPWARFIAFVRRNPALAGGFVDRHGIFHPLRHARHYDETIVKQHERQRELTGIDTIGQQTLAYVERAERSEERKAEEERRLEPYRRRISQLEGTRDVLRLQIDGSPASAYTRLFSSRGRSGESGWIPWATARRFLPRDPEKYQTAIVKRGGKRYLRWEYAADELAANLGYDNVSDFREAVEQVKRDRLKLDKTERQIREARAELRAQEHPHRNPEAPVPTERAGILSRLRRLAARFLQ